MLKILTSEINKSKWDFIGKRTKKKQDFTNKTVSATLIM